MENLFMNGYGRRFDFGTSSLILDNLMMSRTLPILDSMLDFNSRYSTV